MKKLFNLKYINQAISTFLQQFNFQNDINYDKLFENLEEIYYLKNKKKLNMYVKLKKKGYKENDILWSIYLAIKNEAEFNYDINELANILFKMGRLLYLEKKDCSDYAIAEFYYKSFLTKDIPRYYGTVRERTFKHVFQKETITLDRVTTAIQTLTGIPYDEEHGKNIYIFLKDKLK